MKQQSLVLLLISFLLGVTSCKKDLDDLQPSESTNSGISHSGFKKYAWNEKEAAFFDVNGYQKLMQSSVVSERNTEVVSVAYHPELIQLYNEIADQNQNQHFIEDIVNGSGIPIWQYAQIVKDQAEEKTHIIIPLALDTSTTVTGLIVAMNSNNSRYVINAYKREQLLDATNGDPFLNAAYARAVASYDRFFFKNEGDAIDAYCTFKEEIEGSTTPTNPVSLPDCEWRMLEVCTDDVNQITWVGGVTTLPPHLDHDGDGIVNEDDQDWHDFIRRHNIDQDEFTNRVITWWEENRMEDEGIDYLEFINDHFEHQNEQGNAPDFDWFWNAFEEFWGGLGDLVSGFWDWFSDFFGGNPQDDIYFDPYEVQCPPFPNFGGDIVEERTIICHWYFVLDCGQSTDPNSWWESLVPVPCPECPNYQDQGYDDLFSNRTAAYYNTHDQTFYNFLTLSDLIQNAEMIGCEAAAPYFEHCLNEAFLMDVFGLDYTNIFTADAIEWLTNTPTYPDGPSRVYWIAQYWQNEGNSQAAKDRIQTLSNWLGSVDGVNPTNSNQISWMLDNMDQFQEIKTFLDNHPNDQASVAAVNAYWGLVADGVLTEEVGNIPVSTLNKHINNHFPSSWDDEQGSLSSPLWFSIFQTEAEANGGDPGDWLEAIRKALKEGWDTLIKPVADQIASYVQSIGAAIPNTTDEWYVLASVLGPTLGELAIDLIPIVGDAKAFATSFIKANNGEYTDAAIELVGGIAGIVPITKLISKSDEVYAAAKISIKFYKVVRALKAFSSKVFTKLKSWIETGWKAVWDNGASKVVVKDATGEIAGEITEDGIPSIIKKSFSGIIDPSTFKELTPKTLANTQSSNSISKGFINTNGNKFNVKDPSLEPDFLDIVQNGDTYGKKTEDLLRKILEDSGDYNYFDGSYNSGVNGFDGVFIKGDLSNPTEVIINESKQFTGSSITLSGPGVNAPAQMTDDWIRFVAQKLRDQGNNALGNSVEEALDDGILTKVVTAVDRTSGQLSGGIAIIKVE